ncbi:hypothetical protein P5_0008 [Aeromonas phage P5]|nr:hypothetical protein P5_0008 [Aeromonas phage P5]
MYNSLYSQAGYEETKDGGFFNGVADFARYGVTSSLLSGVQSIANTGIAFANTLGANYESLDTRKTLEGLGLDQTAEYYGEHKDALDTVGFVATAFVPGFVGVKVARAAITAGASSGIKFAAGLADITSNSQRASTIANIARSSAANAGNAFAQRNLLIAKGFGGAAVESFAAETAIAVTMNQNPVMDPQTTNYFDAVAQNFTSGNFWAGVGIGTALGGVIEGAGIAYKIRSSAREFTAKVNKLAGVSTSGEVAGLAGDEIVRSQKAINAFKDNIDQLTGDAEKTLGEKNFAQQQKIRYAAIQKATGRDPVVAQNVEALLDDATIPYEQKVEMFSGLRSISTPRSNESLFTVGSVRTIVDDVGDFDATVKTIAQEYKKTAKYSNMELPAIEDHLRQSLKSHYDTAYGFADRTAGNRYAFANADMASKSNEMFLKSIDPKTLDAVYEAGGDNAVLGVLYHEKGHLTADWLSSHAMADTKFGKKIRDQLESLSRIARPQMWERTDAVLKSLQSGEFDPAMKRKLLKEVAYSYNPKELWADAFAMLENPATADTLRKAAPNVTRLALTNKSLSARFGDTKRVLNINTKELTRDGFAFTAADMGVKSLGWKNGGKSYLVELDGGKHVVDINAKFDPMTATPTEASASYWAWMRPVSDLKLPSGVAIEFDDIPRLSRAYKDMLEGEAKGTPLVFKVNDGTGQVVDVANSTNLFDILKASKRTTVEQLSGRDIIDVNTGLPRKMTHLEIARVADTSADFALHQFNANAVDSLVNDVTKPQHMVLRYDRRAMKDFEGRNAEIAAFTRLELNKAHADSIFSTIFKEKASAFPERVRQSALTKTSPMIDISPFEGGLNFLGQANGEYLTGAGFAQAIGTSLNNSQSLLEKSVREGFESLSVKVTTNEKALTEFNVIDAWHRGHNAVYEFVDNPIKQLEEMGQELAATTDLKVRDRLMKQMEVIGAKAQAIQDAGLSDWFNRPNMRFISKDAYLDYKQVMDSPNTSAADILAWHQRSVKDTIKGSKLVEVENQPVADFLKEFISNNDTFANQRMMVRRAQGRAGRAGDGRLYLGPADTARTPYHAYVVAGDEGIAASKEVGVVTAMDAAGLQTKIAQIKEKFGDGVKIVTESDRQEYLKVKQDWDATKRHGDLLVNSELERRGILSEVLPERDPTAPTRAIDHLVNVGRGNMREAVAVKYAEELAEIDAYGAEAARAAQSRFGASKSSTKASDSWAEQKRMMLNLSANHSDNKWLEFQNSVDSGATRVFNGITDAARKAFGQKFTTEAIAEMDKTMKKYGYRGPFDESNPAMRELFVTAGKQHRGALTKVSSMLNSLVATTMLRLDAANWMVNAMSMPITAMPELRILRGMVGEAAQKQMDELASVAIPGTSRKMPTNAKVLFSAMKDVMTDKALMERYVTTGIVPKDLRAVLESGDLVSGPLGDLFNANSSTIGKALNSVEGAVHTAISKLGAGADWSERFSYAVSARAAEKMIDASGMQLSQGAKHAMMIRFATRINGNYAAAQRPALFQGWAGQAIGLFQTYGMNMINNMLRYTGADKKAALSMLGMQTLVFGTNSLPGFEALNRLAWERSGGGDDIHTSMSDVLGKDMSEWILYGLGSNFTKPIIGEGIGVYSRGNVTPMNPLIIPTSLDEVPAIRSAAKTIGAGMDFFDNVSQGMGAGDAFGLALASQGLSRPLQGIGQLANGEVTSAQGNRIYELDLTNWWSTATRLMGAKTLKDAVMQDSYYRMRNYKADAEDAAIEAFRPLDASIRLGSGASNELMDSALQSYLKAGHSYDAFERKVVQSMMLSSQGEYMKMRNKFQTPEAQYLMKVMAE